MEAQDIDSYHVWMENGQETPTTLIARYISVHGDLKVPFSWSGVREGMTWSPRSPSAQALANVAVTCRLFRSAGPPVLAVKRRDTIGFAILA